MSILFLSVLPLGSNRAAKLSKIETLRLARNYVHILIEALHTGRPIEPLIYISTLAQGLSQATASQLGAQLQINSSSQTNIQTHHSFSPNEDSWVF